MAIDLAPDRIRVNAVCPGPTDTPLLRSYFEASQDPQGERRAFEATMLTGRFVTANEVAEAVFNLAAPLACSTTGAAIVVDGGYIVR